MCKIVVLIMARINRHELRKKNHIITYESVQLHSQDCIGIAVVADLRSFLEMTDFEFAR